MNNPIVIGSIFGAVILAFAFFFYRSVARKGAENLPDTKIGVLESKLTVVNVDNGKVIGYDGYRKLYVNFRVVEGYTYTQGAIYQYTYVGDQVDDVKTI